MNFEHLPPIDYEEEYREILKVIREHDGEIKYSELNNILSEKLEWRYYGGKHYESIFTKFYQAYVLPEKFGIDKRKAHFSSLIRNGELSREEALNDLAKPLYGPAELKEEKEYVLKKLGFTPGEFEDIMKLPVKNHLDYGSETYLLELAERAARTFRTLAFWKEK